MQDTRVPTKEQKELVERYLTENDMSDLPNTNSILSIVGVFVVILASAILVGVMGIPWFALLLIFAVVPMCIDYTGDRKGVDGT